MSEPDPSAALPQTASTTPRGVPPWSVTGVGSLPLDDARLAARMSVQECPDFAFLPELPGRGPGADMIGRAVALLHDVVGEPAAETTVTGWRRTARGGRDMRRGASWLREDLDAMEEESAGYRGALKVALTGPWTLAASLEDAAGEKALRDPGFVRDLGAGLGVAATHLVTEVHRRIPGADVVMQWDEPALSAVALGRVRSASGLRNLRAVAEHDLIAVLSATVAATMASQPQVRQILHYCGAQTPWSVLESVPLDGLSLDWRLLTEVDDPALGRWLESGRGILIGIGPTDGQAGPRVVEDLSARIEAPLRRLGIRPHDVRGWTALSARCGLAGVPPAALRPAFTDLREVGKRLRDPTD